MTNDIVFEPLNVVISVNHPTASIEPDGSVTIKTVSGLRVPFVTEWLTGTQVGEALDMTRQTVNKLMNAGHFKTLAAIGDRPTYVVKASEVEEMRRQRRRAKAEARASRLPSVK